ncbi:MAG TPA: hypothetical protein VJB59_07915 [Bdellovibrionota bacterium]|nr:hypothetical protein [Bdellovibrionota bacterium]
MQWSREIGAPAAFVGIVLVCCACASTPSRPCSEGGEPPRDKPFRGTKQCTQKKDQLGQFVNNGPYFEWYPNGKKALEGEYKTGRKNGRWIEWDEKGQKISDRYFEDGKLVPAK